MNREMPERKSEYKNDSGIEIQPLYTPDARAQQDYLRKLGFPGEFPFTRGIYPTMYRGRLWTMRQYSGFGSAEETNERYRYLLAQGQTGLSVAFDLPTQMGLDADHPRAEGEVGKAGVAVSSLRDMQILLQDLPLDRVSTSMTINATAAILLAMYVSVAEQQGVMASQLSGTVQNDILKEYVARKTYIFPPDSSLRLATDAILYCAQHLPRWNPISISGYHMREAGATAVQEIAFALADGIEYVKTVLQRGMDVDAFASQLSFFFACEANFFEEIAKFRAARRLWAQIMKQRFGAKKPESLMLRFHTQTSGATLTAQQPLCNIVRVTLQAAAAVLGGTQSLHTNSYDEALALPAEDAVNIALRTQQIIAEESGAGDTIDPAGGSHYLEWLTDRLQDEAEEVIAKIDQMGGMRRVIERGYVQREIEESAYRKQREIEDKKRLVVGVNAHAHDQKQAVRTLQVPPEVVERHVQRLRQVRATRDAQAAKQALARVREAARAEANLMPSILHAVKAYATVGEICDVLREQFGEYREADR